MTVIRSVLFMPFCLFDDSRRLDMLADYSLLLSFWLLSCIFDTQFCFLGEIILSLLPVLCFFGSNVNSCIV